jgi:hypothetical protein
MAKLGHHDEYKEIIVASTRPKGQYRHWESHMRFPCSSVARVLASSLSDLILASAPLGFEPSRKS